MGGAGRKRERHIMSLSKPGVGVGIPHLWPQLLRAAPTGSALQGNVPSCWLSHFPEKYHESVGGHYIK